MNHNDDSPELKGYHKQESGKYTAFSYPDDGDTLAEAEKQEDKRLQEMLVKLLMYVLPSNNPRLQLTAFAFACGVDLSFILNCDNTEQATAKAIRETQQNFHASVMEATRLYGLKQPKEKPHESTQPGTAKASSPKKAKGI